MRLDVAILSGSEVYRLMVSAIVPRPIAWVFTRAADDVLNLAPFSFFMGVAATPPVLAVSVIHSAVGNRDTLQNIRDTGEFVKAPRVAAAPASMECRLLHVTSFGTAAAGASVIFGEILCVHARDDLLVDGSLDVARLQAIGRMSQGGLYTRTEQIFNMPRPVYRSEGSAR